MLRNLVDILFVFTVLVNLIIDHWALKALSNRLEVMSLRLDVLKNMLERKAKTNG